MKTVFILTALVVQVFGAAIKEEAAKATIDKYENINNGLGNYGFRFLTSNDLKRWETGTVVNAGQPNEHIEVNGEYAYIDPNGKYVVVTYMADDSGFHLLPQQVGTEDRFQTPPQVVATLLG